MMCFNAHIRTYILFGYCIYIFVLLMNCSSVNNCLPSCLRKHGPPHGGDIKSLWKWLNRRCPCLRIHRRTFQDNANIVKILHFSCCSITSHLWRWSNAHYSVFGFQIIPDDTPLDAPNRSETHFGLGLDSRTRRNFVPGRCSLHLDSD